MQSEASIREAASELDEALETGDLERVVGCFSEDCSIELLGVKVRGHSGVRRWLEWVFARVERIEFAPRVIGVDHDTLFEEFGVTGILADGRTLNSQWAETLTYRDDLVISLRLYFNPIDFAPTLGVIGRAIGPAASGFARRGLGPFEPIRQFE